MKPDRQQTYAKEMIRIADLLSTEVSRPEVNKVHLMRCLGHGVALILTATAEALGGDPEVPPDHPGQLHLFEGDGRPMGDASRCGCKH